MLRPLCAAPGEGSMKLSYGSIRVKVAAGQTSPALFPERTEEQVSGKLLSAIRAYPCPRKKSFAIRLDAVCGHVSLIAIATYFCLENLKL
jgi:hypothetical protein